MALAFDPQRYGEALRVQLRKTQHAWSSAQIDKYVKDTIDKMVADSDERDRRALIRLNRPPASVKVADPQLFTETTVKVIKLLQRRFPDADYQTVHDTARQLVANSIGWPTAQLVGWNERTLAVIQAEAKQQKATKAAAAKPTRQPTRSTRRLSANDDYPYDNDGLEVAEPYVIRRTRSR